MTAPIVLRSTDEEAPILSGTMDISRFFNAVLVNGYGTQPGLGWTKEYSNPNPENGTVYRSDSVEGNGFFYRFKRVSDTHSYCVFDAYESMSDYETGTVHFGIDSGTGQYFVASSAVDPTPRPWMIIGDKFGFYMIVQYNHTGIDFDPVKGATAQGISVYYFGDYHPLIPGDVHNSIVAPAVAIQAYTYLGNLEAFTGGTGTGKFIPADSQGNETKKTQGFFGDSILANGAFMGVGVTWYGQPDMLENFNPITRVLINDGGQSYSLRGYMPGLYFPLIEQCFDSFTIYTPPEEPDLQLFAVSLNSGSQGNNGQMLIDLGDGFR